MTSLTERSKHPGGRPPKFKEPSRPVTVTLPERTLRFLQRIDADRAKAIVKATDMASETVSGVSGNVEMVEVAPGTSVLIVPASPTLDALPWLRLIEVAPMRYLITVESGTPLEKVEIALTDMLAHPENLDPEEAKAMKILQEKISMMRRGHRLSKVEIICVDDA